MNYLAHAYFSNEDEGLLVGNFMADHIRGNHFEHLNEEIKKGIYLHRAIEDVYKRQIQLQSLSNQNVAHQTFLKILKMYFDRQPEKMLHRLPDLYHRLTSEGSALR